MFRDRLYSDLENEDIFIPLLIYPDYSDDEDSLSNPPSADPTPDPIPPSGKPTEEPTSEPDYDALLEPPAPTREYSVGTLSPKDIVRYQKGSDPHRLDILEERTKEDPWGDTRKIRILVQYKSLEAVEYLLNSTKRLSQISTNLEEVGKDMIGYGLTNEDMAKLCSTEDPLGQY